MTVSKRPKRNESKLQIACVRWFRYAHPKFSNLLFAIPNGGFRTKSEAARLKSEGVVPGVPDLFLSVPNSRYHGFYIEMKFGKNTMTDSQKAFRQSCIKEGFKHIECRTFEGFRQQINNYLKQKS